jgi:hypothetical protein
VGPNKQQEEVNLPRKRIHFSTEEGRMGEDSDMFVVRKKM